MTYYKWSDDDDLLSEVSTLHYSDLEECKDGELELPRMLCGGDYANSCAVEWSNYLEWQEMFKESLGVDWWIVTGSYSSYGIAVRKDTENQEILDCLAGLKDYPCINDERVSEVENEWQAESWSNWASSEFESAIDKEFYIELNLEDTDRLYELFSELMERSNTYWEIEQHGCAYVRIERLIEEMNYNDLKNLSDSSKETLDGD